MINIMLVGGTKVDDVAEAISDDRYNVVKTHKFVGDAFEDIINNNAIYLDLNVIIVLQHGISSESETTAEKQIQDLQELLSVTGMRGTKIYFALTDKETYWNLEESEESIFYDKARILLLEKLYKKTLLDIIEGRMDNVGIYKEPEIVEDEYTEDGMDDEVTESVFKVPDEDEYSDSHLEDTDDDTSKGKMDINTLRGKSVNKKPGLLSKLGKFASKSSGGLDDEKETDQEDIGQEDIGNNVEKTKKSFTNKVKLSSHGESYSIDYKGIIAVTGDRNSGVTTTAANLAETFADNGHTVLLIDLDFMRRTQYILYKELGTYKNMNESTQQGVYFGLSNPENIETASVVVKDNLVLLGLSRENEYYASPFVEKPLDYLLKSGRLSTLLGVAKGTFDIVVLDFPWEQIKEFYETTIMIDSFLVCVENNMVAVDNMFNLALGDLDLISSIHGESFIAKSNIVLTKFSNKAVTGKYQVDEELVESVLRNNIYGGSKVVGRVSYNDDFYAQLNGNKRVIDLNVINKQEFLKIAEGISNKY